MALKLQKASKDGKRPQKSTKATFTALEGKLENLPEFQFCLRFDMERDGFSDIGNIKPTDKMQNPNCNLIKLSFFSPSVYSVSPHSSLPPPWMPSLLMHFFCIH